ncbi:Hypothetical predicted protein [Paramuricea clavata]|uniref:P2X purinoreceptor 7 intracellular domain-containing protein n=1 Tax=Paramuricea clavata TaxID=317549 RepID=A0A6S7I522_PARCT|nr:Hypothetical predicted protein [Paramuricea clavata]
MDISVTSENLDQQELIQASENPFGADNITVCTCRGMCLRESGRNACPCKNVGHFCSSACHRQMASTTCLNKRNVVHGNLSSDSDDTQESSDTSFNISQQSYGSSTVSRRGRSGVTIHGFGARSNRGRARRGGTSRGRVRQTNRGQGNRGQRNRGQQNRGIEELVNNLDDATLRVLTAELLRRQPAMFADLVNGELPVFQQGNINELPEQPEYNNQPEWCKCGVCIVMPTQAENKCCTQTVQPCITTHPLFYQIVLDPNILDIAMRYKEDVLAMEHPRNNENFRHTAYRQFVLWQHGRLGQGDRRVVPSCCVQTIRKRYPSPNGIYVGFRPARL